MHADAKHLVVEQDKTSHAELESVAVSYARLSRFLKV